VDSSSLLLIASANYILRSKDKAFALKYLDNFENIIKFNQSISTGNIVWQHNYSSWLDSIRKEGYSLYPTVCSYKAAISLSEIYRYIGKLDRADKYSLLAEQIKTAINSKFWNGNYYNDLYNDDGKLWTNFTSDGNILTVYWEVADKEQSQKIFNYIEENELDRPWPIKANFPAYDSKYIYWLLRFIGIGDYQTRDTIWLWIGCLLALTEMKYDTNKAIQTLLLLSKLITENNDVYEVYEKTGKPVKRFLYESEHPFAWSAGLFLEAVSEFEKYTNLSIVFS
jgi:glycogen debranching enzyme